MNAVNRHEQFQTAFGFAQQQVRRLTTANPNYYPMYTTGGKWLHQGEKWTNWCEGFLPGMMWIFYEQTGDASWRTHAEHYSRQIEPRKDDREVHDLGFLFYHGTYRRWYEATVAEGTADPALQEVVFHAGRTLAMRFKPKGRYLRSFVADESLFVDIMMNVPIILYAALGTNDQALLEVGTQHCLTSRRTLVRGDGSTAHEAIFDTNTGECLRQSTHQGYRGDSCWSRGLAWALYGFATTGKLLKTDPWLNTSRACADYLLEKLTDDAVPPWDFDASDESRRQKDSSAGAIAAAGLFELHDALEAAGSAQEVRQPYVDLALRILDALCDPAYLAINDQAWEGILKHGVYHIHKHLGVDESVMWGEFFFVDALQRALRYLAKE
jgi:unsaturated chondroitin disaccharide hydrolase